MFTSQKFCPIWSKFNSTVKHVLCACLCFDMGQAPRKNQLSEAVWFKCHPDTFLWSWRSETRRLHIGPVDHWTGVDRLSCDPTLSFSSWQMEPGMSVRLTMQPSKVKWILAYQTERIIHVKMGENVSYVPPQWTEQIKGRRTSKTATNLQSLPHVWGSRWLSRCAKTKTNIWNCNTYNILIN